MTFVSSGATDLYVLDANVLIYAFRQDAPQHQRCYEWLTTALSRGDDVTAPSVVELALVRICTLQILGEAAASTAEVFQFLQALRKTSYRRVEPGEEHGAFFQTLCADLGLQGNDVNGAFLAALVLENRATLVTTDKGFDRFPMIRLLNPLRRS